MAKNTSLVKTAQDQAKGAFWFLGEVIENTSYNIAKRYTDRIVRRYAIALVVILASFALILLGISALISTYLGAPPGLIQIAVGILAFIAAVLYARMFMR